MNLQHRPLPFKRMQRDYHDRDIEFNETTRGMLELYSASLCLRLLVFQVKAPIVYWGLPLSLR